MLISILDQEYDVTIPAHILDKIDDEGIQRLVYYLVFYAKESTKARSTSSIRRYLNEVAETPSTIWPMIAMEQSDGERPFVHPAFQRSVWDHHELIVLCGQISEIIVNALPGRTRRNSFRRITGPQPTV